MGRQLAIEFRRLLKSPTFYIAIAIGLYIAISHVVQIPLVLEKANSEMDLPHSVFTCMMDTGRGSDGWQPEMLISIAPVLVALPFGVSFYTDRKSGYIKNLFIREKKGNYLIAKYIVTFVSGGCVVALPELVNFIGNCMVVPLINPIRGTGLFSRVPDYLEYVYYEIPVLFVLCVCLIHFIVGGLLATMCLGVTYLVDIVFLVQLFPVIFVYLYNMFVNSFMFVNLPMFREFLEFSISERMTIPMLLKICAIMAVFSVIYFYNGYREETL